MSVQVNPIGLKRILHVNDLASTDCGSRDTRWHKSVAILTVLDLIRREKKIAKI